MFSFVSLAFSVLPAFFSHASSLSYIGVAVAMDCPNWIVDGGGDLPPEPGEIDHGLDFEWDVAPVVREVF